METKELKIQIPDGYEIDKDKSTFEKIVFKKKESTEPRSWEEYCKNHKGFFYFINNNSQIITMGKDFPASIPLHIDYAKNAIPSRELAEAFLAMMQLMSLRQAWIGDWKPDWNDSTNWCIIFRESKLKVDFYNYTAQPLSFPTKEMAEDFRDCFKDLLEIAQPLI